MCVFASLFMGKWQLQIFNARRAALCNPSQPQVRNRSSARVTASRKKHHASSVESQNVAAGTLQHLQRAQGVAAASPRSRP